MPEWFTSDYQRLALSLIIGALIGAEREYRSKSAGLRTMVLVCVGSCLFTILSIRIGAGSNSDRIASNIITGIGFLGAGVIFKETNKVIGITTATTIWMSAALGMAAGSGYFQIAWITTGIILLVLVGLAYVQRWIERANQMRDYKIVCMYNKETLERYEALFNDNQLKAFRGKHSKEANKITGNWLVQGSQRNHEKVIDVLLKDESILEFDF